jgi:hypothetical protein
VLRCSEIDDTVEFVLWLVWTFLTLTPAGLKNPVCSMILTSQDVVAKLMASSLLVFAPGLLDVLQAETPPPLAWFKSLPTEAKKRWGVYVIVFEKKNCRPKIYIGSGTSTVGGVSKRLQNYVSMTPVSRLVKRTVDDGYTVKHRGLLCWAPLPEATERFALRVLFLVLETAFSIAFWAMYSKTKDYGMPRHLCAWKIEALDYDGLCSHPAVIEQVSGETLGLTDEQIKEKEAELFKRHSDAKKALYYGARERDFDAWKATRRLYESKRDLVEKRASGNMSRLKAKKERRFECKTCSLPFESQYFLNMHYTSKRHVDKVRGIAPKVAKTPGYKVWADANIAAKAHYCKICDFATSTTQKLDRHFTSQRHKKRAAEARESSS